jgi:hypothetical protein
MALYFNLYNGKAKQVILVKCGNLGRISGMFLVTLLGIKRWLYVIMSFLFYIIFQASIGEKIGLHEIRKPSVLSQIYLNNDIKQNSK